MDISKKIKQICMERDLKIGEFAKLAGYSPNAFYVKLCRNTMSFDDVEKIMDALDVDIVFADRKTKKVF